MHGEKTRACVCVRVGTEGEAGSREERKPIFCIDFLQRAGKGEMCVAMLQAETCSNVRGDVGDCQAEAAGEAVAVAAVACGF